MNSTSRAAVSIVALCLLAGNALAETSITRIGTLGGTQSNALDINDSRQVVGQANFSTETPWPTPTSGNPA